MADLERSPEGVLTIKLIFQKGIRSDFYDAQELVFKDDSALAKMSKEERALQRNKERSIGFIIEKVSQWRKLYNGYEDENGELRRMSLEEAATKVDVSKKSLDDYLS